MIKKILKLIIRLPFMIIATPVLFMFGCISWAFCDCTEPFEMIIDGFKIK